MKTTTPNDAKDLKDLRAAHKALSGPIKRLVVVRLTALAILVFSFGRAFDRMEHTEEAAVAREAVEKAKRDWDAVSHDDQAAQREYQRREIELDAIYEKAFTVKLPIPETEVEVDLRYWVYALPFALIISQLVLVQLARRQRLLGGLAARRVAALASGELTSLDRLTFPPGEHGSSQFLRFPTRLLAVLETAAVFTLLVDLIVVGRPLWQVWSAGAIVAAVALVGTVAFYAVAYDALARAKQEGAVAALVSETPRSFFVARVWSAASARGSALAGRLRPPWSLGVGSVLLLFSLVLPLCVTDCGHPMRGADLVRGYGYLDDSHQEIPLLGRAPTTTVDKKEKVSWFGLTHGTPVGRGLYGLALLLAAAAPLVLVLRSRRSSAVHRLAKICRAGSVVLWLFVLNESFASAFVLPVFVSGSSGNGDRELLGTLAATANSVGLVPMVVMGAVFFLLSVVLWARAGDQRNEGDHGPRLRGYMTVLYLPHAVLGSAFVIVASIVVPLPGLAAHFAGLALLAHGFSGVAAAPNEAASLEPAAT